MQQALRQPGLNLFLLYHIGFAQAKVRSYLLEFSLVKIFSWHFVHIRYCVRDFIKINFC